MKDVIVKKNGEPYASAAVARQQRSAMYMEKTHEVVPYRGGYGLKLVVSEAPITLRPGDYVSTEGVTEDQYHAVAKAFVAAGAKSAEYPDVRLAMDKGIIPGFGWRPGKGLHHGQLGRDSSEWGDSRRLLTIAQVLSATNAGGPRDEPIEYSPATPIDTLHAAERQLLDAQEALRSAEAVFGEAMDAVRAELGGSFTLTHEAHEAQEVRDLPPEEWKEGDLVECVTSPAYAGSPYADGDFVVGRVYRVAQQDGSDAYGYDSETMGAYYELNICFRFHSRPTK